jgi:hypothetical protein
MRRKPDFGAARLIDSGGTRNIAGLVICSQIDEVFGT